MSVDTALAQPSKAGDTAPEPGPVLDGTSWMRTSGALLALHTWWPGAHQLVEMVVLVAANALSTVLRFVAFRAWIFRGRHSPAPMYRATA